MSSSRLARTLTVVQLNGSLLYTILGLSRTAASSRLGGRVMVTASDCSRTYEFFLDRSRLTMKSGRIGYGRALFTLELSVQISNYFFLGLTSTSSGSLYPFRSLSALYFTLSVHRLTDWQCLSVRIVLQVNDYLGSH